MVLHCLQSACRRQLASLSTNLREQDITTYRVACNITQTKYKEGGQLHRLLAQRPAELKYWPEPEHLRSDLHGAERLQPKAACLGTAANLGASCHLRGCSHKTASVAPCHTCSRLGMSQLGPIKLQPPHCLRSFASHLLSPGCVPTQVHLQMREAGAPSHPPRRGRHPPARSTQTRAAPGGAPEGRGRSGDAPSAKGQASPAAHTCNRSGALFATRSAIHWGCLNAGQVLTKGFQWGASPWAGALPLSHLHGE